MVQVLAHRVGRPTDALGSQRPSAVLGPSSPERPQPWVPYGNGTAWGCAVGAHGHDFAPQCDTANLPRAEPAAKSERRGTNPVGSSRHGRCVWHRVDHIGKM